jgi:hypothetical protein
MNFLHETITKLHEAAKVERDVLWVGNENECLTWEDFKAIANFNYNTGYGMGIISPKIKVVGTDWWLERSEYDGSEWWSYKSKPQIPALTSITEVRSFLDFRKFLLSKAALDSNVECETNLDIVEKIIVEISNPTFKRGLSEFVCQMRLNPFYYYLPNSTKEEFLKFLEDLIATSEIAEHKEVIEYFINYLYC